MHCLPDRGCCDWDSRRDNEVNSLKDLFHVCDHPVSDSLGLHKLLSFEGLGDAEGDSNISSHLPFQAGRLQCLHLA